ncbi:Rha family transcriptional regulator [Salmonella enterica]|uniref:Rha family transcriptional regulator n=1 Tax=Enterobacteriaceae TaxID=543 RepID=UPI00136125C3|nr:Rha family transcriptional regulator [Salmonella enterica]EBV7177680.1 Rha family transcriptional regulator [Salmonella enterica subsp. enterica serovar Thompson]ECB6729364.1 Rha family transcriptional regulator [Salmonella enterica subsp. enterica serovar Napoli]ECP8318273.1 Rha family transcriptional regulator [Salmonella enterica subsp. enterica serovar Poona]EEJ7587463.1 Rha family transcriptional regulator [Salmonella enterica subsp. enterica]HEC7869290.1 Rha family transcriptional reg
MSTEISIRVPKVIATPAEFAEWEGYSRGSVYQMIHNGKLAKFMEKKIKEKDRVFIRYLEYKKEQVRKNMGQSAFNFNVVVGE